MATVRDKILNKYNPDISKENLFKLYKIDKPDITSEELELKFKETKKRWNISINGANEKNAERDRERLEKSGLYEKLLTDPKLRKELYDYYFGSKGRNGDSDPASGEVVAFKEDESAIPENLAEDETASGIEIRRGEDIFFRGAVTGNGEYKFLYNEDGSPESLRVLITMDDGTLTDDRGNLIGPMEPTASDIIELAKGPELTHRGDWALWLEAVIFCIATALAILFADEIFRLGLRLQIKNADMAEPSDWEIAGRYVAWTLLPILAFIIFIVGLLL